MGAGTTALVARELGRHYIGIELNPEYVGIAERRLDKEKRKGQKILFVLAIIMIGNKKSCPHYN